MMIDFFVNRSSERLKYSNIDTSGYNRYLLCDKVLNKTLIFVILKFLWAHRFS